MSACHNLAILFVHINEISFKALIHFGSEAVATANAALVVQPEQYLKEYHFQAVLVEEQLTSKVSELDTDAACSFRF